MQVELVVHLGWSMLKDCSQDVFVANSMLAIFGCVCVFSFCFCSCLFVCLFLRQGLSMWPWLSWKLLCRPVWPQTLRDPTASVSHMLRFKICTTTAYH